MTFDTTFPTQSELNEIQRRAAQLRAEAIRNTFKAMVEGVRNILRRGAPSAKVAPSN